jgi:uncharacterized membrane protein YeaQ/YmgE (transglycosylase-associated protein family)
VQTEYKSLWKECPMMGVFSWVACGLLIGFFVSQSISARDKGLVAMTLSVGSAGGLFGGLCGQIAAIGNGTTFSFYGVIFAALGAGLALFTYRRLIGV